MGNSLAPRRRWLKVIAALGVAAIAVSACGGSSNKKSGDKAAPSGVEMGQASNPKTGGTLTYALEGETLDFCLASAQLAIGGIMIVNSVYDTLTIQNADGEVVPFLAESVEPNADFTQWTIKLREGIKFHNGEPLDADAVKLNLDANRGDIEGIVSLLFSIILNAPVDGANTGIVAGPEGVVVVDPLTVQVNMVEPFADFPSFLWSFGRAGIMAPEQINLGDEGGCATRMIGTGPFVQQGEEVREPTVTKNPDYWRTDANNVQLPYLDEIQFKVQPDSAQRANGAQGGQFDLAQFSGGDDIATLEKISSLNTIIEPDGYRELGYLLINNSKAPFDNINARRAVFLAANRAEITDLTQDGNFELATGVYDTKVPGYLSQEDSGMIDDSDRDAALAEAKDLVATYKEESGQDLTFEVTTTTDPSNQEILAVFKENVEEAGITVTFATPVLQSEIINLAIGGNTQAFLWRNQPGQTCTWTRIWFLTGLLTNFAKVADAEVDAAYNAAKATDDPDEIKKQCEIANKRMNEQAYNGWNWFTNWSLGANKDVNGIYGPDLPDGSAPPEMIAGFHLVDGLWLAS